MQKPSPQFPTAHNAVPRGANEAFHEIIVFRSETLMVKQDVHFVGPPQSFYKVGEMVGKRTDQVGRAGHNNELFSDDGLTFDKINQAINSSRDVVTDAAVDSAHPYIRVVLPVLVIPDGSLWQVDYDGEGNITERPRQVSEATYFIDHEWSTLAGMEDVRYLISHLHVVTFSHLERAVKRWIGPIGFFATRS
jgi:YD repeat-containing protein